MRRREFITLVGYAAVAWPPSARAQEPVRRIGLLTASPANDPIAIRAVDVFQQGLRDQGLHIGEGIRIEYRGGAVDPKQAASAAKELVSLQVDVIVVATTPGLSAVARETQAIPIVFVNVADPIGGGFISGLARPGGNITGFANFEPSMAGKWLEILKEVAPGTTRVLTMYHHEAAPKTAFLHATETAARSMGLAIVTAPIKSTSEIEAVTASFAQETGDGLVVFPDSYTVTHRASIIRVAATRRLPAVYPYRFFALDGGLASYGLDLIDPYRLAASYVSRILRGEKPGDLPVQQPTKSELVVNLRTANALGLTVPPTLLARADEVIE